MKKRFLLLCVISILFINFSKSQPADSVLYNNLYYTCKIWGFVKYFHSNVANALVDWDQVLLNTLPDVYEITSNEEFNTLMASFIESAGQQAEPTVDMPEYHDSTFLNLNTTWFDDSVLSNETKSKLNKIKEDFRPRSHSLISEAPVGGNPTFEADNKYYESGYYNKNIFYLALFRYWNILEYYFPYKDIMDQNWDTSLKELIPIFANTINLYDYTRALMQMRNKVNDSHAYLSNSFYSSIFGNFRPPIHTRFIEGEMVVFEVFDESLEINKGDIIKEVNGYSIPYLIDSLNPYMQGSNESRTLYTIAQTILGGSTGSYIDIVVDNGIEEISYTIRRSMNSPSFRAAEYGEINYKIIEYNNKEYGYIHMGNLLPEEVPAMYDSLKHADYWIFDIRNYPNKTIWYLIEYLYPAPIHMATFTRGDIRYPGHFFWENDTIGNLSNENYEKPYAILFDERTQSQAEFSVMGLEINDHAIKIGSQTSAADGDASTIYLPLGTTTMITMKGTFYPDLTPTQRIGMVPDIEVKPTVEGLRAGKDEVLEAAFHHLYTSTKEIKNDYLEIRVYPNPTKDFIYIQSEIQLYGELEIFDMSGKLIFKQKLEESERIDVSSLESGTYFISILTKETKTITRFIKN